MKINFVTDIFGEAVPDAEHQLYHRHDLPAGSAQWARSQAGELASLIYTCPCGCAEVRSVAVTQVPGGYGWQWNGNLELPTLSPSLQHISRCRWHDWLQQGEWRTC